MSLKGGGIYNFINFSKSNPSTRTLKMSTPAGCSCNASPALSCSSFTQSLVQGLPLSPVESFPPTNH